jgi:hypothetical protein
MASFIYAKHHEIMDNDDTVPTKQIVALQTLLQQLTLKQIPFKLTNYNSTN